MKKRGAFRSLHSDQKLKFCLVQSHSSVRHFLTPKIWQFVKRFSKGIKVQINLNERFIHNIISYLCFTNCHIILFGVHKTYLPFFEKNPVDIFWKILPQCAGLSRPRSKGTFHGKQIEEERDCIILYSTYFVYELYCNTSEWGHGKKTRVESSTILLYTYPAAGIFTRRVCREISFISNLHINVSQSSSESSRRFQTRQSNFSAG